MAFTHDTEIALQEAAALVNTRSGGVDLLNNQGGLDDFLARYPFSGTRLRTPAELASVRALRARLHDLWTAADRDAAAAMINNILTEADARPYLSRHDQWDWHLHVTTPDAPLAQRIGAEAAMGFLDLVRADDLGRLKVCDADDCADVLIDLSRNKSKRYCDTGNCGNRTNVAAYRARRREAASG